MLIRGRDTTNALMAEFIATPVEIGESGCKTWQLNNPDNQVQCYLKYGNGPLADAIANEMVRLRWMRAHLPVPEVIQFVGNADESWLMTEAIPGLSARQKLEDRQLSKLAIVDALAGFMRQVHNVPQNQCPYDARLARRMIDARARIDAGAVDVADFDEERQGWSAEDVWAALQSSEPQHVDIVFTHGDFSLDNILLDHTNITGCIDVGGAGLADRYQDIAICWSDLAEFGINAQERFLEQYGVGEGDREKLAFYQLLNELF